MVHAIPSIRSLAPVIAGLALARAGLTAGSYGSYVGTDGGMFADSTTLLMLLVMTLGLIALMTTRHAFTDRTVRRTSAALMTAEGALLAIEATLAALSALEGSARLLLSSGVALAASGAMFFWLRLAKGAPSALAVTLVFGALAASELILWAFALMPYPAALALAALGALGQLPAMRAVPTRKAAAAEEPSAEGEPAPPTYFGVSRKRMEDAAFLVATAFGIGLMGVVAGLLRGYPDGLPIAFTPGTRAAYALLTMAASVALVVLAQRGTRLVMTITVWVLVQLMACAALVGYALWPEAWEVGAVFAGSLNSLMLGVVCYTIIAFETHGWRDAAYYALAGWLVWFGSRTLARLGLLALHPFSMDTLAVNAVMTALIVASTQMLFASYLRNVALNADDDAQAAEKALAAATEAAEASAEPSSPAPSGTTPAVPLARLMGLDGPQAPASERQVAMQRSIAQLGSQFLLSEREVEVLTLYAQGYTQKRVAEALFISQGTAHTHIKRIYTKTGMHSRQDILDYLESYVS